MESIGEGVTSVKPGKGHAQAHTQESALKADGAESASLLPHRCLKTERTLIAPNCHWTDTFMSPMRTTGALSISS